jgi:hypothetical protein
MIGFSKVGEFKINREGPGQLPRIRNRDPANRLSCGFEPANVPAARDASLSNVFYEFEEVGAFLFLEYVAEKLAERANIATQRTLFELRGKSEKLF